MKKSFFILIIGVLLCFLSSCKQAPAEQKFTHAYPNTDWERFAYITDTLVIDDTASAYKMELTMNYTADMQYDEIPIVFILNTPDGEEACVHPTFKPDNPHGGSQTVVAYPFKYFNATGNCVVTYFHKLSNYDLFGVKSTTLSVSKVAPEDVDKN